MLQEKKKKTKKCEILFSVTIM